VITLNILCFFGIFSQFCAKKNLATLPGTKKNRDLERDGEKEGRNGPEKGNI
jgi:hypothetical protein